MTPVGAAGRSVDKQSLKAPMSTWAAVLLTNPLRTHALSRARARSPPGLRLPSGHKAGGPLDRTGLSFMTKADGSTWWPLWGAQAWPWHPDPGPYLLPIISRPVLAGLFFLETRCRLSLSCQPLRSVGSRLSEPGESFVMKEHVAIDTESDAEV